jgi:ribosomal protein S18 acetylase RimI-like enzyme
MEVHLRTIRELGEALSLAERLDELGAEQTSEFREEPYPVGSARAFLEAELAAPETLFLVAESAAGRADLGLLLVGPLQEPLTRERIPLLLLLHVSSEVRHRGLARELVAEAWAQLSARGATRFAGRVGHNDDALISMGERWGFTRRWEWIERER